MNLRALLIIGISVCFNSTLYSQVEIYRKEQADTATYIAPEDTITKPPMFGSSEDDFYLYLANRFNMTLYGRYLTYMPENIQFSFYVERNGRVNDFEIFSATEPMLGDEIERIVTYMPEWTPGKQDGKKKRTLMIYNVDIQMINEHPYVQVTKNTFQSEFSNRYKSLKWFLIAGSVLVMVTFLIVR